MLIVIDPHSGVPVYRQLMDQIRFHVASGQLKPGEELPSTRALSAELDVNPMTISKAYALLEREGLLDRRPGLTLVVASLTVEDEHLEKIERLRQSLAPSAAMVRQLGITEEEAAKIFEELLDQVRRGPLRNTLGKVNAASRGDVLPRMVQDSDGADE